MIIGAALPLNEATRADKKRIILNVIAVKEPMGELLDTLSLPDFYIILFSFRETTNMVWLQLFYRVSIC